MVWQFANGGLSQGDVGNAPTYDDIFMDFNGQKYFRPGAYDPALAMTLNAGGAGKGLSGLDAFITHGTDETTDPLSQGMASGYKTADLQQLAQSFGINSEGMDNAALQSALTDRTKNYLSIGGMSSGWNPTGDPRQGNTTLYESRDGKLVPIQTSAYHAPETGSWLSENKGILAPLAVMTGGLAYGALAGAGAGAAGGGAAASGAGGAGITGTAGASGMAAYGAGAAPGLFATAGTGSLGAGLGGMGGFWAPGLLAGSTAYGGLGSMGGAAASGGGGAFQQAQDWYNSLNRYQQGALRGAGQNFVTSGGNPRAAVMGGLTGGIGGGVSDALGGGFWGNLGGKIVGGLSGNALGSILGGGGSGGSSGGGGGGGLSGGAVSSPVSQSSVTGTPLGAARAQELAYLNQSYKPIAMEQVAKRLADKLDE